MTAPAKFADHSIPLVGRRASSTGLPPGSVGERDTIVTCDCGRPTVQPQCSECAEREAS